MNRPAFRQSPTAPPIEVAPDPRAAHTTAVDIDGRWYKLRFWTEEQWRQVPAGEFLDGFRPLSGFGMLAINPIATIEEKANAMLEAQGEEAPYPEVRELFTLANSRGLKETIEMLRLATEYGFGWVIRLLRERAARKDRDDAYWHKALERDRLARERVSARRPEGYRLTTMDLLAAFEAKHGQTLDDVLHEYAPEVEHGKEDMAVWRGSRLVAVIRYAGKGKPAAVERFIA